MIDGMPQSASKDELAWLVERGPPAEYAYMDDMGIQWTSDPNKAMRFARREDAEMFAAGSDVKKQTPKQAGAIAARLRNESRILDEQADALINGTAIKIAPVTIGAIITQRDDSNRLRYYRVDRVYGCLHARTIHWRARAFRCTRNGEKRGGHITLSADSVFECLPSEAGDTNAT